MREYLPYIVLAAVVVAVYVYRQRSQIKLPGGWPSPNGRTSSDLFAAAQALARLEAAKILDTKFAEDARKAAIAIYHAPFSAPPVADDKPAA